MENDDRGNISEEVWRRGGDLNSRGETPVALSRTPFFGDSRLPPYRMGYLGLVMLMAFPYFILSGTNQTVKLMNREGHYQ